jgi:hypothetical protein
MSQLPVPAYIVLSHGDPAAALRLIRRIRSDRPASIVVSHHDPSNGGMPPYAFFGDSNVLPVRPAIAGGWGDYSVLQMVLSSIDTLYRSGRRFSFATLLSGQDYPIKPLAAFEAAVEDLGDGALDIQFQSPDLERYTFAWRRIPAAFENGFVRSVFSRLSPVNERQRFVRFAGGRIGCRVGVRRFRSPLPKPMVYYKGSQWWTLSERCLQAVQQFRRDHPEVLASYRHAIIPDESFFQTVLYNDRRFALTNDDLRFIQWRDHSDESPATLTSDDVPAMRASRAFFARKFNSNVDAEVLDTIDRTFLFAAGSLR